MVVVFCKGDDETLGSNLQATAAGNLKCLEIPVLIVSLEQYPPCSTSEQFGLKSSKCVTNLNMRALKLSVAERRVLVFLVLLMSVDGDVELVPVGVTNQDVAGVRNVNSVWETSHLLRTDLPQQLTFGGDHYYIVVPEVAHVIVALHKSKSYLELIKSDQIPRFLPYIIVEGFLRAREGPL